MTHHIKTGFGIADNTYTSSPDLPLYGAGQGSVISCLLWALISTITCSIMTTISAGLHFESAWRLVMHKQQGDSFVDDAAFGTTTKVSPPVNTTPAAYQSLKVQDALTRIQMIGQGYKQSLWTTSGALNMLKCLFNIITWDWKDSKARMVTSQTTPGSLELTSSETSTSVAIRCLEPNEVHCTLGVYIVPSRSNHKSREVLQALLLQFVKCLHSAHHLVSDEAFWAYTLFYQTKVSHPLPVSTFSIQECTHIQAPASKHYFPDYTAYSIIHGPEKYGGLGKAHLYLEQDIG